MSTLRGTFVALGSMISSCFRVVNGPPCCLHIGRGVCCNGPFGSCFRRHRQVMGPAFWTTSLLMAGGRTSSMRCLFRLSMVNRPRSFDQPLASWVLDMGTPGEQKTQFGSLGRPSRCSWTSLSGHLERPVLGEAVQQGTGTIQMPLA